MENTTNRLASRGADFGDSSLNITYRNVRDFIVLSTLCFLILLLKRP